MVKVPRRRHFPVFSHLVILGINKYLLPEFFEIFIGYKYAFATCEKGCTIFAKGFKEAILNKSLVQI